MQIDRLVKSVVAKAGDLTHRQHRMVAAPAVGETLKSQLALLGSGLIVNR